VAVEGLTPPKETKIWPDPKHWTLIKQLPHYNKLNIVNLGLMLGNEVILTRKAPHEVRFVDGSLISPIIQINQAIAALKKEKIEIISKIFYSQIRIMIEAYLEILRAEDKSKATLGMPKSSPKKVLPELESIKDMSERSLMTFILNPGEFIEPNDSVDHDVSLDLNSLLDNGDLSKGEYNEIFNQIQNIRVVYYRPNLWTPAFRLDLPLNVYKDKERFTKVLKAVQTQCFSSLFEPFPLYLADQMVKSLKVAIPPIRQAIIQQMAIKLKGSPDQIYFNLHSYRTEEGF
ncbi:MAG: DNA double-strand break repair nuclease NurA, partial [Candidatus Helarchaeota archaeon]